MSTLFVGVDTSNYTTSLSLIRDGKVEANVRRLLPVGENKRGLRQSDAVFFHTKALPELAKELFSHPSYRKDELCAVGVSSRPRSAEGSYMPCFLAGVSFASALSASHGVPLFSFSHQQGHIAAAIYSSVPAFPDAERFLSFHVSGGTTDIVLCKKTADGTFSCEKVGGTTDLNAGQAIDRTGVRLGIPFPCGKTLDELSQRSNVSFGKIPVSVNGLSCSLSGLENKTNGLIEKSTPPEEVASFLFEYLSRVLLRLTENLRECCGDLPILFAGGVMANTRIRENLSKQKNVFFASPALSSDNACGVGLLARERYERILRGLSLS